jgi:hypothetical protein
MYELIINEDINANYLRRIAVGGIGHVGGFGGVGHVGHGSGVGGSVGGAPVGGGVPFVEGLAAGALLAGPYYGGGYGYDGYYGYDYGYPGYAPYPAPYSYYPY